MTVSTVAILCLCLHAVACSASNSVRRRGRESGTGRRKIRNGLPTKHGSRRLEDGGSVSDGVEFTFTTDFGDILRMGKGSMGGGMGSDSIDSGMGSGGMGGGMGKGAGKEKFLLLAVVVLHVLSHTSLQHLL